MTTSEEILQLVEKFYGRGLSGYDRVDALAELEDILEGHDSWMVEQLRAQIRNLRDDIHQLEEEGNDQS
jgi:hypothetical protein